MEAKQKALVLCALTVEAKRIDDPRYQFDTEEKDGVVVRCIINNAEVLDVPERNREEPIGFLGGPYKR